ncbi:MAG: HAMP domain-containing sensor histidine kinase [Halodesulfurarchaeum sp.]|nr:HAMP domain-containing sensor histidine kinase [Halodesulfurarchaeum sp.]
MVKFRQLFDFTPRRIAGGYAVSGAAWIALSDRVVFDLFGSASASVLIQTVKGWIFVGVSAGLLFGLTRVREEQLEASKRRAIATGQQLQVLQRLFRHNVRNDMTVVRGNVSLIREQNADPTVETWLGEIEESTTDLLAMSEKLQILNDVEVGENPERAVDIVSVIEMEVNRCQDSYPEATIETDLPEQRSVEADWSIQYAIREALQNAMDHHNTPEAERHVEITCAETVSEVRIEIADDGPGIPADEIAPIESGTESPLAHGSGVGLWIIAWLCQSFDGSIDFDGSDGTTVGMTFTRADPIEQVTGRIKHELYAAPGE